MCNRPLLGGEPAVMCIEGVDLMNDDPTAVDVLFAKVTLSDKSNRLIVHATKHYVNWHAMNRFHVLLISDFKHL